MLNWAVLPGNSSFQQHFHQDMQEIFVILSGEVEMQVAGEHRVMQAGDTVIVDPGELHQMRNLRAEEARYIVFGISSGQGGRTIVVRDSEVNATSASAG
jgi:mannose-6-phosphate isomerase-like protein (cupin superfamily)